LGRQSHWLTTFTTRLQPRARTRPPRIISEEGPVRTMEFLFKFNILIVFIESFIAYASIQ
jgi:hypothetical protein